MPSRCKTGFTPHQQGSLSGPLTEHLIVWMSQKSNKSSKNDFKPYFNMGDPRFQVVYFFIKLTYPLCHLFCLIPIKCYLQIWDHSLNLYPFSRVNLPQNGCVSGAWEFALEKRLLKKWGLVTWEIGG